MKQQGFHIAERSSDGRRPDDALQGSSQTSSKLAEGLQGLMDMCNAGSLMTAPPPAMVGSPASVALLLLQKHDPALTFPSTGLCNCMASTPSSNDVAMLIHFVYVVQGSGVSACQLLIH